MGVVLSQTIALAPQKQLNYYGASDRPQIIDLNS